VSLTNLELSNFEFVVEPELDRRERLLLIAAKYFLNKGYSATSVDEIAEAAGTTGPVLYRIFDGKQGILDQL
jgi:AcrR family transcriptional regulator